MDLLGLATGPPWPPTAVESLQRPGHALGIQLAIGNLQRPSSDRVHRSPAAGLHRPSDRHTGHRRDRCLCVGSHAAPQCSRMRNGGDNVRTEWFVHRMARLVGCRRHVVGAGWLFAAALLVLRGEHRVRAVTVLAVVLACSVYAGQPETLSLLVWRSWCGSASCSLNARRGLGGKDPDFAPPHRHNDWGGHGAWTRRPIDRSWCSGVGSFDSTRGTGSCTPLGVHDLTHFVFQGFDGLPHCGKRPGCEQDFVLGDHGVRRRDRRGTRRCRAGGTLEAAGGAHVRRGSCYPDGGVIFLRPLESLFKVDLVRHGGWSGTGLSCR